MTAGASILAGAFLGFLFGVPRAVTSDLGGTGSEDQYLVRRLSANTNLEQVSDWLTKIIVGVTLIQLGNISRRFADLTSIVASVFGEPTTPNRVMAGAIMIYFAVLGFLAAYLTARSLIQLLFYFLPPELVTDDDRIAQEGRTHNS